MNASSLLIPVTVLLLAAGDKVEPPKGQKGLEGKWQMVSSVRNGKERTVQVTQVIIKTDKITFVGPDGKSSNTVPYKTDPSKKPKAIDITSEKGDEVSPGIYSLDGDTLKICTARPGAKRPTEFESKQGSDLQLLVLKRENK